MPTGYTHAVQSGEITTFKDFALRCARAFGACVEMRDDSTDTPIPDEFQPSDYHQRGLEQDRAELARVEKMTENECVLAAMGEHAAEVARRNESDNKAREGVARYQAMLAEVQAWSPPTSEHAGLKSFMVQQLVDSIKWDGPIYVNEPNPDLMPPAEWKRAKVAALMKSIDRHIEGYAEGVARAASRTQWIRQLRDSVKPETVSR